MSLLLAVVVVSTLFTFRSTVLAAPLFVAEDLGRFSLIAFNDRGTVLGHSNYESSGRPYWRGECWIRFSTGSTRRLVPPLSDGDCLPLGLNDNNQAFGVSSSQQNSRVWFFDGTTIFDIGVLSERFPSMMAKSMNRHGQIVGQGMAIHPISNSSEWHAFVFTPGAGLKDLGVLARDPANPMEELFSGANDINDSGVIVGTASVPIVRFCGPNPSNCSTRMHAFRTSTTAPQITDLTPNLGDNSQADAVTNAGTIVYSAETNNGTAYLLDGRSTRTLGEAGIVDWNAAGNTVWGRNDSSSRLLLGNRLIEMPVELFGFYRPVGGQGRTLNDAGQVVGGSGYSAVIHDGRKMTVIYGDVAGPARGLDINNNGWVVGASWDAAGNDSMFVYDGRSAADLANLAEWPTGCRIINNGYSYIRINDRNQIASNVHCSDGTHVFRVNPAGFNPTPVTYYYYGLGDSVASGHGLYGDSGACRQSRDAYPRLAASSLATLGVVDRGGVVPAAGETYLGCSGASTTATGAIQPPEKRFDRQVNAVRLDQLRLRENRAPSSPRIGGVVSITIGANDFPWANASQLPRFACGSDDEFYADVQRVAAQVQVNVESALRELTRDDNVFVVVTDYHNPLNRLSPPLALLANTCQRFSITAPIDLYPRFGQATLILNRALSAAVANATAFAPGRVALASVHEAFRGHEAYPVCGLSFIAETWIQIGASQPPLVDCAHPNDLGARAYANAVANAVRMILPVIPR